MKIKNSAMNGPGGSGYSIRLSDIGLRVSVLADATFAHLGTADDAQPGALAYCENEHYLAVALANPNVAAILVREEHLKRSEQQSPIRSGLGIAITGQPKVVYWGLHNRLVSEGTLHPPMEMEFGIGSHVHVHPSASISPLSRIGDRSQIGPGAVVDDYSIIGEGCRLGPGAVVGAEGLQTVTDGNTLISVRHGGGARLGDGVTVLANAVVSRAARPVFTEVGNDCVISILSSVGHRSNLGRGCQLAGNVVVGGSVRMGEFVWVGPAACIKDGLRIGHRAQIKLGSVVVSDVPDDGVVSGNFAIPHRRNLLRHAGSLRD